MERRRSSPRALSQRELDEIARRAQGASPMPWTLASDLERGDFIIAGSEGQFQIQVKRDFAPASTEDLEFIAHARQDVPRLVDAIRTRGTLSDAELDAIEARAARASEPPWVPFIEDEQPIGGSSVIWISDDPAAPDMYIWLGPVIAPREDVAFIANARQDVPALVTEARRRWRGQRH